MPKASSSETVWATLVANFRGSLLAGFTQPDGEVFTTFVTTPPGAQAKLFLTFWRSNSEKL